VIATSLKQSKVNKDGWYGLKKSIPHWVYQRWPWKQYNRPRVMV